MVTPSRGAIPAPASPSQTAPAAAVRQQRMTSTTDPASAETPDPTPDTAAEAAPQPTGDPDDTIFSQPAANAAARAAAAAEPPTEITPIHEPSIEAPGADARVGEAAAAFAAGAAGGTIASKYAGRSEGTDPAEGALAAEEAPSTTAEAALAASALEESTTVHQDPAEIEAAERLRAKVAEIKAGQPGAVPPVAPVAPQEAAPEPVADPEPVPPEAFEPEPVPFEVQAAEQSLDAEPIAPGIQIDDDETDFERKRLEAEAVQREIDEIQPDMTTPATSLEGAQRQLEENRQHRDEALMDAEERLRSIESRAQAAESRAAFAERLTQLNAEETDREQRLNDVLTGIDRAEQRTREAEERAAAAEAAAAAALQATTGVRAVPPAAPASFASPAQPPQPTPPAPSSPPPATSFSSPAETSEPEVTEAPRAPEAAKPSSPFSRIIPGGSKSDGLNLNTATFEELRGADLSVTQATRILAYRERFGGYSSIDDLEKVPGFPADVIEQLRDKISV